MDPVAGDGWIAAELFWRIEAVRNAIGGSDTAKVSLRSYLQQRNMWHCGMVNLAAAGPAVEQWRKARGTRRSAPPRGGPVRRRSALRGSWQPGTGRFIPWSDTDDCA